MAKRCIECDEPMLGDEPEDATICSLCNDQMGEEADMLAEEQRQEEESWPPPGICGYCGWPEHEGECE